MLAGPPAAASSFHADQTNLALRNERVENPEAIPPPADTRQNAIRQPALGRADLANSFFADNLMKVAHHQRIWMRSQRRPEQVMRRRDIGHPVSHGLADRVLQRSATG